ncbi:MAG: hypothetical protein KQH57_15305 [Actinomycetales bacterium]|nr:hypothetical protein [Actinomycetales bacterium]
MTALVALGARLVRAGGALRLWSVVGGCAVAVALLTTAWALPDALYPVTDPLSVDPRRGPLVALLQSLVVPVLALVLTVGRLSSQLRDRRLASLRLLGVSRRHAGVVAVVENAIPAVAGATLGAAGYLAARTALTVLLADQLQAPITLPAPRVAAVAAVVVAASVALALASLHRLARPRDAHAPAAPRRPSLWRLAPLFPSAVALAVLLALPTREHPDLITPLFLIATVGGALGIALIAPLASHAAAAGLVRNGRVTALLAGRGIQTGSSSIGRRVVALGLAVYVVVGGAGMLGVYQNTLYLKAAIHQFEVGPQKILVTSATWDDPLPTALLADLVDVPGVRAVVPGYDIGQTGCGPGSTSCLKVFVGTCEGLAALVTSSGCTDGEPAWIDSDLADYEDTLVPATRTGTVDVAGPTGPTHTVQLSGTITQDVPATTATWVWPGQVNVFLPASLADRWGMAPTTATVVADTGAQVRRDVAALAGRYGAFADSLDLTDYRQVLTTRTAASAVMAIGLGVALLGYGLATVDRARETRRSRARLVAVGVPARLLRRVGAIQSAVPLATTVVLAAGLGLAATLAVSHSADQGFTIDTRSAAVLLAGVVAGGVLVSVATMPLTRAHVTAGDLREE